MKEIKDVSLEAWQRGFHIFSMVVEGRAFSEKEECVCCILVDREQVAASVKRDLRLPQAGSGRRIDRYQCVPGEVLSSVLGPQVTELRNFLARDMQQELAGPICPIRRKYGKYSRNVAGR